MLAAHGVDARGAKQLLGLRHGAAENAPGVKDLLRGLLKRGLSDEHSYLFVIDSSKALRAAITEVFGDRAEVQRCRTHKVRQRHRAPAQGDRRSGEGGSVHAAYQLSPREGMAKFNQQAQWLKNQYPDVAASLLEGLEETFTVNRLGLTPALMRCLATTNIIENSNGIAIVLHA